VFKPTNLINQSPHCTTYHSPNMTQETPTKGTSLPSPPTTPKESISETTQVNGLRQRKKPNPIPISELNTTSPISSPLSSPSTPQMESKKPRSELKEEGNLYGFTSDEIRKFKL
jgi:hypothetical protein